MGWKAVPATNEAGEKLATLVRITVDGETEKFPITSADSVIGSASSCNIQVRDDRFVSDSHARIYRDEHNRWFMEDLESKNGSWVKSKKKRLDMSCFFQCGEQRFYIRIT